MSDAPADVIPRRPGPSRDAILAMNAAMGAPVDLEHPGEVMVDLDGIPVAVEPSRRERAVFAGATLTRADLDRVGLVPADVPNIRTIDTETEKNR